MIKKLPDLERPYEKLELYGEENLTNAELLAIIIKSGTKENSAIDLAQEIINIGRNCNNKDITFLKELSINKLTRYKGDRKS